jgi:hypothetical protein
MKHTTLLTEHITLLPLSDDDSIRLSKNFRNVPFELNWTNVYPKGYGAKKSPYENSLTQDAGYRAVFPYDDGKIHGFRVSGLAG